MEPMVFGRNFTVITNKGAKYQRGAGNKAPESGLKGEGHIFKLNSKDLFMPYLQLLHHFICKAISIHAIGIHQHTLQSIF